jgi:type I restriction enzyme S subunit
VINKMKAWSGSLGIAGQTGIVSPAYFVYDVAIENKRYAHLLLRSRTFVDEFARCSGGVRVGQWDLNIPAMKGIRVRIPSGQEQGLIVRYLDHAELRIAKAIAAKQDVVRLLKEHKAVVESRALFGGGWTTGVEKWFGEVPAGWEVLPSRALFAERIERNRGDLEMLSVTMARGVVRQSSYLKSDGSKKDQAREDRSQYKAVEPDDLVYNKMRAWQGAAGRSEFRGIVSPAYVVLRPLSGANSDYYGMMLRSRQFAREAERHSYGITSDMWSLRPQHFKLIEFPCPPLAEQAAIVNLCKAQTEKIDAAIEATEAEITLLKEYRTRLISDVVTGKLDVRDEAAKIPEIDPMELATVSMGENGDDEEETDDD